MKYLNKDADPATTIKHYEVNGCNYQVEYMDGSTSAYFSSNPDEVKHLEYTMITQAKERNQKLSRELSLKARLRDLLTEGMLIYLTGASMQNEHHFIATVLGIASVVFGTEVIRNYKRQREIDKFDMLFSMYEDLDKVNDAKFMEAVEYDHFYQKTLDINNIDDFTYGDVKTLKRNLQK